MSSPKTPKKTIKIVLKNLVLFFTILFNIIYIHVDENIEKLNLFFFGESGVFGVVFLFFEIRNNNLEEYDIKQFERLYGFRPKNWSAFFYSMSAGKELLQEKLLWPKNIGLCSYCYKRPESRDDLEVCEIGFCKKCRVKMIEKGRISELYLSKLYKLSKEEMNALKPKKQHSDMTEIEKLQYANQLIEDSRPTKLRLLELAKKCHISITSLTKDVTDPRGGN